MKRVKDCLKNCRGTSIISYIIVIAVTVTIAVEIVPHFNRTAESRSAKIINVFNSTDTITNVD